MHEHDNGVRPKVKASAAGAGVGVAVGEILIYLVERTGEDLPTTIEAAVVLVVSAGLAFLAGYFKQG